jgi:hypothetical protein
MSMARDGLKDQRLCCDKRGTYQVTVNYHTNFNSTKVKVNFALEQATKAQKGVEIELNTFCYLCCARWVSAS